eukprot:12935037-Prorocentrum_lima.AAC.1
MPRLVLHDSTERPRHEPAVLASRPSSHSVRPIRLLTSQGTRRQDCFPSSHSVRPLLLTSRGPRRRECFRHRKA